MAASTTITAMKIEQKHYQTEKSRAIALEFCRHVNDRRFDLCGEMFTPNAQWWVVARQDRASWGGSMLATERASWAADLLAGFEKWSYTVEGVTADGERVVVEGVSRGRGPGIVKYDNVYLMQFKIDAEEGKIKDFKECMDCYSVESWLQLKEEHESKSNDRVSTDSASVIATL